RGPAALTLVPANQPNGEAEGPQAGQSGAALPPVSEAKTVSAGFAASADGDVVPRVIGGGNRGVFLGGFGGGHGGEKGLSGRPDGLEAHQAALNVAFAEWSWTSAGDAACLSPLGGPPMREGKVREGAPDRLSDVLGVDPVFADLRDELTD